MKITTEEVDHVAVLARLKFSEEEKERFVSQLNSILEYMGQLGRLDTSSVEPTFHAVSQKNVFREDVVQPSLDLERTLANGPDPDRGFFRVPKIIE
jgi:aspartyl-tRNA(Asn)/glutamyl-tRNA(Gln) amidotransferase subunit C